MTNLKIIESISDKNYPNPNSAQNYIAFSNSNKELMNERKPIDFSDNDILGNKNDPSTWSILDK